MNTTNIKTWLNILPNESDRTYNEYLVIPWIGVVVPVIYTPTADPRYKDIAQGRNLDVNEFLKQWVHQYPGTSLPGQEGNALIGGHSNFFKNQSTDFTTIFAQLPMLDVNDQVWYYKRNTDQSRVRYVYQVARSYETSADDAKVFEATSKWSQITLYTCVPIGTSDKRWIVRTQLLFSQTLYYPTITEDYSNFRNSQWLDDEAQKRLRVIIGDIPAKQPIVEPILTGQLSTGSLITDWMTSGETNDSMINNDELLDGDFLSGDAISTWDTEEEVASVDTWVNLDIISTDVTTQEPVIEEPSLTWRQQLWQWIKGLFR